MLEQMKSIVGKFGGWSLLTIVFACLLIGLEAVSFFVNGLSDTYGHLLLLKSLPCLCVSDFGYGIPLLSKSDGEGVYSDSCVFVDI